MSTFHGICSCPHGMNNSGFLWAALAAATVCTCYSIASCRLFTLEFTSDLGNFEDHFVAEEVAAAPVAYQVGVGLFTWLRPSFYVDGDDDTVTRADVGNWQEGSCVGYNTLQLDEILDDWLEATRILGVFSVLISMSIFLFSLMLSCLEIANWQRYLLTTSCLFVAVVNGLVLLMNQSELCTNMGGQVDVATQETIDDAPGASGGGNQTTEVVSQAFLDLQDEDASKCVMDQGALVAIAAVILWVSSALLAYFFVEPLRNPQYEAQKLKQQQLAKRKKKKQQQLKQQKKQKQKESSTPRTIQSSFSIPTPKSTKSSSSKGTASDQAVKQENKSTSKKRFSSFSNNNNNNFKRGSAAVAATPTLHDNNNDDGQGQEVRVHKSSFQRASENRAIGRSSSRAASARSGGEEKKSEIDYYNQVPMQDSESSESYDCIPLQAPPSNPTFGRMSSRKSSGSNLVKQHYMQKQQLHERQSSQHSATAGEILIDLRGADSHNNMRRSTSSNNNNKLRRSRSYGSGIKGAVKQHQLQQQQIVFDSQSCSGTATSSKRTASGNFLQEMERVLLFTDLQDQACGGGGGQKKLDPPGKTMNNKMNNYADDDDVSQLTFDTAQRKKAARDAALERDLALQQQQSGPFAACDPGCLR